MVKTTFCTLIILYNMSNKLKLNYEREKNNLANCLVNHPESPLDATLYIIYYV